RQFGEENRPRLQAPKFNRSRADQISAGPPSHGAYAALLNPDHQEEDAEKTRYAGRGSGDCCGIEQHSSSTLDAQRAVRMPVLPCFHVTGAWTFSDIFLGRVMHLARLFADTIRKIGYNMKI